MMLITHLLINLKDKLRNYLIFQLFYKKFKNSIM